MFNNFPLTMDFYWSYIHALTLVAYSYVLLGCVILSACMDTATTSGGHRTCRHACMTSFNSTPFPLYDMMYLQTGQKQKGSFMTVYSPVSIVVIQYVQPVHSFHMYHGKGVREELGF